MLSFLYLLQVQRCTKSSSYSRHWKCPIWRFISLAGRAVPRPGTTRKGYPDPSTVLALRLQMKADHYFYNGLAENTHRTYNSAQCQYIEFCDNHQLQAVPGSENTLALFTSYLAGRIKPQSIKVYLAGIRLFVSARVFPILSLILSNCSKHCAESKGNILLRRSKSYQ